MNRKKSIADKLSLFPANHAAHYPKLLIIVLLLTASLLIQSQAYAATASSVSQFGITWTFNKTYTTGQFANGDSWVIGPVTIIGINPPSANIGGRIKNGSMLNPSPTNDNQGYDTVMLNYDPALNVALDASAQKPLVIQPGSSLVSVISIDAADSRPQLRTAAILTVLSAAPLAGSFRPAYAGTDKTIRFNKSQLNYPLLAKLPPVSNTPRLQQLPGDAQNASVERMFERPWLDHRRGWYSDWYHPSENMLNYGRDFTAQSGIGALMLHLNFTDAQKETLLIRYTQIGIDCFGVYKAGATRNWEPDGGTGSGRKWPIVFAGLILGDSDMTNIGQHAINDPYFGEDGQTFYVQQTSPGVYNYGHGGYTAQDVGLPEWGIRHATNISLDSKVWDSSYRRCCTADAWGGLILAARIMNARDDWNHDSLFDYMDRYMATEVGDLRQWDGFTETMWNTYRASFGPIWPNTSPTNQPPIANAGPDKNVTDSDGNGSELVSLDGSASTDSDGTITSYVWTRNGTQIATGQTATATLPVGQNTVTLTVTDNGGAKSSDTVIITVVAKDTTPPSVVSVTAYKNSVEILFSEALNQISAQTIANYSISSGISVSSASLDTQHNIVTLTTSAHQEGISYTLTVKNVRDIAGNTIPTTTQTYKYDAGLAGYWRFDDASGTVATDSSDNSNNGTLIGQPLWVSGKFKSALDFITISQAVEVPTKGMNINQGTICMWAYPSGFPNVTQFMFGHVANGWGNRIQFYTDNTGGGLGIGLGDTHKKRTNIYSLPLNAWAHIALTWDGTNYAVYVNGVQSATGTYTGLTALSTYADIANTGNRTSRQESFDGSLDDVRIYNRTLNANEILDTYQSIPYLAFYPIGDKQTDEGKPLTFTVETVDSAVQVQLTDHNLPGQPTFANNTFSWTPTYNNAGSYEATFVAPLGQLEDFETITITVNNVNRAPVLLPITNKTIYEKQILTFSVNALDPDGDAVTYSAANLPAGAAFAGKTFSWTPTNAQAGTYQVTFTASDGKLQDSQAVSIVVNDVPVNPVMVGYWQFDTGTAMDSSGMGNTGTLINQPLLTNGKFGFAVRMLQLNHAVEVPTNGIDLTNGTISMWVYPTAFPKVAQFMFGHVDSSWKNRIQIYTNSTSGALGVGLGNLHKRANNIYNLPLNAWTHIALIWNGVNYAVYVNGTQYVSGGYSGLSSISSYADIGNTGNRSDRNEAFMGTIDEVRIYNRVLTPSEIAGVFSYRP